jgi:CubicO group peptidase (beta-lactamase class C family)
VESPLAVGPSPLFQIGSTTKTYTATAIMALAEAGKVGLDEPVRAYVPEFRLRDEAATTKRHRILPARQFAHDPPDSQRWTGHK